jgi:peptide/nickel transport system permease protein
MNWWQQLNRNGLARLGAITLVTLYVISIGAEFVAPYDPLNSQKDGSLLPPTPIHFTNDQGEFIAPIVYPVTQGQTDLATGDRKLKIDRTKPSPLQLFVAGDDYKLFSIKIPKFPKLGAKEKKGAKRSKNERNEVILFPGFDANLHLFGTSDSNSPARINLLGTDEQGRDQFSRLIYGSRISLFIGLIGILISFPLGMLIGGVAGYFGGWLDTILMRAAEVLMTMPSLYLLVALAAILPDGISSSQRFLLIVIITSFIGWAGLARVVRGQVLSIKQREFIQAAQVMGANPLYIVMRHVLPQTSTYLIIAATLAVPGFIISESVLSLIGLGIQQPDPSWGNMLSLATNTSILQFQPWLVWPPALLIAAVVLSFNLLGDGLRDALDPRSIKR